MPPASTKPFRRHGGDDQGLKGPVRLVVACLEAERKDALSVVRCPWSVVRGRQDNERDGGHHVVRTPWGPARVGKLLSAVTGPVFAPN